MLILVAVQPSTLIIDTLNMTGCSADGISLPKQPTVSAKPALRSLPATVLLFGTKTCALLLEAR